MKYTCIVVVIAALFVISCRNKTLFTRLESSKTNILFNNEITENDSLNPLKEVNIYNGGGVGVGDFNNDGLQDLYFSGNQVSNKLYVNKGDFKFDDVTQLANVGGDGRWCKGVAVVDINNDGWQDIYISVGVTRDPEKRRNLLYINNGLRAGHLQFTEMAKAYGLDDTTHTTMSYFFDYDNDGDLDVYMVVNHHINTENQNTFRNIRGDGSHPSTGRLYRNNSHTLPHPVFENVSEQAGMKLEGYGHAAVICDINNDGWKDIYVTNDFLSSNILYINNRNGTFTDSVKFYFKHASTFSMGADMQDINNDGLPDLIELDMNPEDNYRKKMMLDPNNYQMVRNYEKYNYHLQYMRNTLQLNQGNLIRENDSIGHPVFSDISYLAGVAETDWSWTPLLADFDDDGFRDIIITNGYRKDVTDHDFMVFRSRAYKIATSNELLRQVPEVKLRNYAFRNNGDLTFSNKTFEWGFEQKNFSNGAAYADLDNDGDLDIVINNIDDKALVYKNTANSRTDYNYLNISLAGDSLNRDALDTKISVYHDKTLQTFYFSPFRGYLSSHQRLAHFGLGQSTNIDSIIVIWPNGKKQRLLNVASNQLLLLNIQEAEAVPENELASHAEENLFTDFTKSAGIDYTHYEKDFVDFNIQKLLPHKFSQYSPALAAGDLDGNGLDDIVCGGTSHNPTIIFFQQSNGKFKSRELFRKLPPLPARTAAEIYAMSVGNSFKDAGILLFDADKDEDLDIYLASGGYAYQPDSEAYQDRFFVNDGNGNFSADTSAIRESFSSKSCIRAADFDQDGDLDLFLAGRVAPGQYPKPVASFIFRNDSKKGFPKFTDVTSEIAGDLLNIGLICDAVFSDFNNDGWTDLVLAGEWMPLTFLKNTRGVFRNVTTQSAIESLTGWWNSLAPGDFDNDGDIDYIAANLGMNSYYKTSAAYPVSIVANDFDTNGSYDAVPFIYLPASHDDTTRHQFPAHTRDDLVKQLIGTRRKFTNYRSFAKAGLTDLFSPSELTGALRLSATCFSHMFIRNDGDGRFSSFKLPVEAQVSALNGMFVDDFDGDGNLDVIINGNDYSTEVSVGNYDGLNGLILKGDGQGKFSPLSIERSGIYIPGDGKALVHLRGANGRYLIAASQNNGPLKIFSLKKNRLLNHSTRKTEKYYGYSFLSQSTL